MNLGMRSLFAVALPTVVAVLGATTPARADVLPADECTSGVAGDPCSNAGSAGNEKGVCTESTCTSLNYSCDGGVDSGHGGPCGSKTSACLLCMSADAGVTKGSGSGTTKGSGTGTSKGSGSGTTTTKGSGSGATASSSGSSSSCAAAPVGTGATGGALFFGLGAVALMVSRRRRQG